MVSSKSMKTLIASTALSTKLALLLCAVCMGFLADIQESFAGTQMPCHQEMTTEKETQPPCDMCETSLETWEEKAVIHSDLQNNPVVEFDSVIPKRIEDFSFQLKRIDTLYEAYYPPPMVLLKAVTPNTKTIVLLS